MASYLSNMWQGMTGSGQEAPVQEVDDAQNSGIMSSIFSKGAKMASSAVGASPVATLELTAPPNQRLFFVNGDEISGALSMDVPNEIQHQGIRVILRGTIANKSSEMSYGAIGGMLSAGAQYEFIQLTRDLDAPGSLQQGTFDYRFNFKNVDLDVDSYCGISMDVRFEVSAEMVYQGSMMNYTVKDSRIFQVRNSLQHGAPSANLPTPTEENKETTSEAVAAPKKELQEAPRLKIDFHGFRASEKPCHMEVYLHNQHLHLDRDQISGYLSMKELAPEIQSRIKNVKLQFVQQEIQGSTKSWPSPAVGQAFVDQMNSGVQPYKMRIIKDFQVMDGCCDEGDTIDFRLPLRGAACRYLCPTVKNVYNKFSVRFFIRVVFFVKVRFRVAQPKQRESNNDGASSEEEDEREAIEGDDDFETIESFSEQSEVSSNFLEVNLWR